MAQLKRQVHTEATVFSVAVANWFIENREQAFLKQQPLTNLRLQKLVYFAHGWYAGMLQKRLIIDPVEAWKYGPVFPKLYRQLKDFEERPVLKPIPIIDAEAVFAGADWDSSKIVHLYQPSAGSEAEDVLRQVADIYGNMSAGKLVGQSHAKDRPWRRAIESFGFTAEEYLPSGIPIEQSIIEAGFIEAGKPR